MKRFLLLMLALLLLVPCALAQEAAVCKETPLLAAPDAQSQTLMRYYIGTRVEVIREADADYVQVNVGKKGGSLMGYMAKEDLAFGEKAIRQVRADVMLYYTSGVPCTLYGAPDTRAEVIDAQFGLDYKQALGYLGDEWLHVEDGLGGTGFVCRDAVRLTRAEWMQASHIYVEPAEDELSVPDAVEAAKALLLADYAAGRNLNIGMENLSEEGFAQCTPNVKVLYRYDAPDRLEYQVDFWMEGHLGAYAYIYLIVSGEEIVSHYYGNG